jgi:UbiD family decarboxylase
LSHSDTTTRAVSPRHQGPFRDLRAFLAALERQKELITIDAPVSPRLELPEIHRRVIAAGGGALLFKNVIGSPFPVVTNLFGTKARIELALGDAPKHLIARAAEAPELFPPTLRSSAKLAGLGLSLLKTGLRSKLRAPVLARRLDDLTQLPALTCWEKDGGPFLTWPLVQTRHPEMRSDNLGIYRMQIFGPKETGMHFQIAKGGGFHLHAAETLGRDLPVAVHLGGPPLLTLAAACPLPENIPEILMASWFLGERLRTSRVPGHPLPAIAEAEFCLSGFVRAHERRPEGPFGDHYGYYSLQHDFPVFHLQACHHRADAIFPATVVGKPRQEDFFLGDYLQELLLPMAKLAMPQVRDLWSYGEAGYHAIAAAVVRERYARESMTAALRLLGEGQVGLSKVLFVTETPLPLRDFPRVLTHMLERVDFSSDCLVIPNVALDTLDYAGPRLNHGSKMLWVALGPPKRRLPTEIPAGLPTDLVRTARVFAAGVLVVDTPHAIDEQAKKALLSHPALKDFPLVVLVDDAARASRSVTSFLWHTFTRFDPQQDFLAREERLDRNVLHRSFPVMIDARMKPSYPEELFCDPDTSQLVSRRWHEYFPSTHVAQGDSLSANLFS